MTVKRTTTLLVSLLVALCSGTNYVYSVYGPQLGRRLQLSYTNQNVVGLSGNYGLCLFAPLLGRLADLRGPRPCLALSFILLLAGYLGVKVMYDASEHSAEPAGGRTLLGLVLFELFSGMGSAAGYSAALNAVMKSFPDKIRTTATGVVISGLGLSAFLFSTIARTIFLGNTSDFLLILALGTSSPMILGWLLIRICPYPEHVAQTISENDGQEESNDPSLVPDENSQLLVKNVSAPPPSIAGLAMIRTADFWILFWIVSLLSGSGIMWINNVGLMARALLLESDAGPDDIEYVKWQTLHVSTLSVASCVGRLLIGVIADFAKYRGIRRVQCFSIVATSFFISQLVGLAVKDNKKLQYAVTLVGISYGAVFGLAPIIVVEWFGMAHVSENCGIIALSLLVMGNVFSMMFGWIFDAHSTHDEQGVRCLEGTRCYSASL